AQLARDPAAQLGALSRGRPHEGDRGIVHVEVAVLELLGHRRLRPEVDHVERAERYHLRYALLPRDLETVGPGREHPANQIIGELGGRDVEHTAEETALHQRLHRLPAGAGGVEHQDLVALLLQHLTRSRHTWGRHAEHGGTDQWLVTGVRER